MLHANLAMFSNVFAMCSCPFRCHFVRGLNLNVRHPFFSFLGSLMFPSLFDYDFLFYSAQPQDVLQFVDIAAPYNEIKPECSAVWNKHNFDAIRIFHFSID
jgi:hypothetical protein